MPRPKCAGPTIGALGQALRLHEDESRDATRLLDCVAGGEPIQLPLCEECFVEVTAAITRSNQGISIGAKTWKS